MLELKVLLNKSGGFEPRSQKAPLSPKAILTNGGLICQKCLFVQTEVKKNHQMSFIHESKWLIR